jgi:hypothetical protein
MKARMQPGVTPANHAPQWHSQNWATTAFAALALGATRLADLLRVPAIMEGLAHLG